MESDLDAIAGGEREARPWLRNFYFGREPGPGGAGRKGLQSLVGEGVDEIDARAVCSLLLGEDEDGREVAVRVGRYGPYVQAGDDGERVSLEENLPPDEMTVEKALSLLESAAEGKGPLGHHPETGEPVYVKTGRYGDYVQLGDAVAGGPGRKRGSGAAKPKMASLWSSMDRASLTLDEALLLLSFPRELGRHPESDEVVTVQDGRYGAYVRCGKESRSLESQEQMATVGLDEALALLRQPKRRRGSSSVLKELGEHPQNGLALSIKTGRFGPYVTDGQVNATVPKGKDPQDVDLDEAVDLLAAREAKMVAQGKNPRAPRRGPARKRRPAKKKTTRR